MNKLSKSFLIFFVGAIIISALLFLVRINLFAGEIVLLQGITETKIQAPLSLSYFIGIGIEPGDLDNVKDFYLLPSGWITAIFFIVAVPALIAYRIYLRKPKN